jgi:hypothetical protein
VKWETWEQDPEMTEQEIVIVRVKLQSPAFEHDAAASENPGRGEDQRSVIRGSERKTNPTFFEIVDLRSIAENRAPVVLDPGLQRWRTQAFI